MSIKEFFVQEYDNIFRFHSAGAGGLDVSSELSQLVDATIEKLWNELPEKSRDSFAVVALGGYGRYEMAPHSDVDVMVLFEHEDAKKANSETAQKFLHSMWNLGFDVGHSVRTIKDCLNLYQTDVDVWASVLESRYVCGNQDVMNIYTKAFLATIQKKQDLKFINSVIAGVDERHRKYEHSVKLLEPNLKNSAGGIRDLHSLVWIYRSTNTKYFTRTPFHTNGSGCLLLFEQLAADGIISNEEKIECTRALNGILRLRNELHYHSNAQQDILEFSKQLEIARSLGYRLTTPVESVEQCMREYYLFARTVYGLNKRLINHFRSNTSTTLWSKMRDQNIDGTFSVKNEQLFLRSDIKETLTLAQIVTAFFLCSEHEVILSSSLQSAFNVFFRSQPISQTDVKPAAQALLNILRSPANVASTLQMMNDADVLGKIMPEWGDLVAFFQHSMYHYYTTDAHTLIALEHAEKLFESKSILGETLRHLPKREIFYFAILFHDIAKPLGIAEHEIRGVEVWKKIRDRFGFTDEHDDVSFLIRNHLIMEQVAFRRNTNDAATIEEFAKIFSRPEQLDMLFLLTYCDLSAVNKNVWSSWKETLLQELYVRTRRRLTERESAQTDEEFSTPYNDDDLALFKRSIVNLDVVSFIITDDTSNNKITIITHDAPYLLSTLCGVLSANDVSIIDATIYTQKDGIVIDTFRVVNAATKLPLTKEQEASIRNDLYNVLTKNESLERLFERHHRRWKRRAKPLFHPSIRVDAEFHDANKHTIIEVYAPDMTGFLFKITKTLSGAGLQIDFAKLATRGDGIVDSFYVKDKEGKPISSEEQKQYLREKILHTIDQLMNVQLET
jgi:[protein-PII] uridylyltransferase